MRDPHVLCSCWPDDWQAQNFGSGDGDMFFFSFRETNNIHFLTWHQDDNADASQGPHILVFPFAVQLWRLPFITNTSIKSIQARVQSSYQTNLQIWDSNPPNIIISVKPSEINGTSRHTQKSNLAKLFECYQCQYRQSIYQRHYSKIENTKGLQMK